jgi:hypothetical protein
MPYANANRKDILLAGVRKYYDAGDFEMLKAEIAATNISTVEGRRDILTKVTNFMKAAKLGRELFGLTTRFPEDGVYVSSADDEFQRYVNAFAASCEWRATSEAKDVVAGRATAAAQAQPRDRATEERTLGEQGTQDATKRIEETRLKLLTYDRYVVREDFERKYGLTWT